MRNSTWGAGCVLCHAIFELKHKGAFENELLQGTMQRAMVVEGAFCGVTLTDPGQLKPFKFRRHQSSKVHTMAEALVADGRWQDILRRGTAPGFEEFTSVWERIVKGGHSAAGVSGVGASIKVRRMLWCLAEAVMDTHRKFLASAVTMV